jgi:hypothetical protein
VNASTAAESPAFVFDWEPPRRRQLTMLGFIAASLIAHALCFYLFQIVYPPTVAILPPPARISLVSWSSEEGRNLLRWIEAEDPALAFATQRSPEARLRALPKVEHIPSYLANEPPIQQPPPLIMDVRAPSAQSPGPVPILRAKRPPPSSEVATTIFFPSEFAGLGDAKCAEPKFTASSNEPAQAMQFCVAVNARGEIRHCFAMNSSGDHALDEQARQHVVLCRFPLRSTSHRANEQNLTWGVATIEWGTDVARPQAMAATTTSSQ